MRRPNSFGQVPHEVLIDAVVRLRRLAREQDPKSPFVCIHWAPFYAAACVDAP